MQETSFVNMVNEHKKPTGNHFQKSKTAAHSFKDVYQITRKEMKKRK
jgi:hypothetical protein